MRGTNHGKKERATKNIPASIGLEDAITISTRNLDKGEKKSITLGTNESVMGGGGSSRGNNGRKVEKGLP